METGRHTFKEMVRYFHAQNMSKLSEGGGVMILYSEGNAASPVWDLNYIFNCGLVSQLIHLFWLCVDISKRWCGKKSGFYDNELGQFQ